MTYRHFSKPKISVIMTAFNAEGYISHAIDSILNQTYANFDFIICDDASTDRTLEIIKQYAKADKRIKVIANKKNLNIGASANKLLKEVKTNFVARMDADDIAFPDRLNKQVKFLLMNPDVVMVGGQCITIDENDKVIGHKWFPTDEDGVKNGLFEFMTIQQPSTMINLSLIPKSARYYQEDISPIDDLEFLFRILNFGRVVNLEDYLIKYRVFSASNSLKNPKRSFALTVKVRDLAQKHYNYKPTLKGYIIHNLQRLIVPNIPSKLIVNMMKWRQMSFGFADEFKQTLAESGLLPFKKKHNINIEYKFKYHKALDNAPL